MRRVCRISHLDHSNCRVMTNACDALHEKRDFLESVELVFPVYNLFCSLIERSPSDVQGNRTILYMYIQSYSLMLLTTKLDVPSHSSSPLPLTCLACAGQLMSASRSVLKQLHQQRPACAACVGDDDSYANNTTAYARTAPSSDLPPSPPLALSSA